MPPPNMALARLAAVLRVLAATTRALHCSTVPRRYGPRRTVGYPADSPNGSRPRAAQWTNGCTVHKNGGRYNQTHPPLVERTRSPPNITKSGRLFQFGIDADLHHLRFFLEVFHRQRPNVLSH